MTGEDIDLLYSVFQKTLPDLIQTVIFLSIILDFVWNLSSHSEVAFIFLKYHQTDSFSVRYCIVQFLRWYSTLKCYSPTRCFINQPLMLMSSPGDLLSPLLFLCIDTAYYCPLTCSSIQYNVTVSDKCITVFTIIC